MLVLPNDELREAVDGNWGVVNLPVWTDNEVRSVYTSVTASNIMGIASLPQEDAVPSLTTVAARSLGVEAPKNPQQATSPLSLFAARNSARDLPV